MAATSARRRILDEAADLFYRQGVRAVGVDTIIARSGVAKMSLYRHFASKDDLIVAYLEERRRAVFAWWDEALGPADAGADAEITVDPRARLVGLLAAAVERSRRPDFRGCPFLNAGAELPDDRHPARAVIAAYRAEARDRLVALGRNLGACRPGDLATQLLALLDGIFAAGRARVADEVPALLAAAESLIAAQVVRD